MYEKIASHGQPSVECQPKADPEADCGIFEGVVHVFGSPGNVISSIDEFMASVDPQTIHQRLIRVFPTGNSEADANVGSSESGATSGYSSEVTKSTDYGLSVGGAAGIIVTLVALLIGVGGFIYYKDRRHSDECDSSTSSPLQHANEEKYIQRHGRLLDTKISLPSID